MQGPPAIRVELAPAKLERVRALAKLRHDEAIARGLKGKHGGATKGADSLALHVTGAWGEFAVAQLLGLPEPKTVNTFLTVPDLPFEIEVKTRTLETYELIVRPGEGTKDRQPCVLVWHGPKTAPAGWVRGWIYAGDARARADWLKDHGGRGPAYFVPFEALRNIERLMVIVEVAMEREL